MQPRPSEPPTRETQQSTATVVSRQKLLFGADYHRPNGPPQRTRQNHGGQNHEDQARVTGKRNSQSFYDSAQYDSAFFVGFLCASASLREASVCLRLSSTPPLDFAK